MSLPKVSPAAMRCLVLFSEFIKAWGELPHGEEFGTVERLVTTALARVNWARGRPSGHPLEEASTCADELLDGSIYERALAGIRKDLAGCRGE